MNKLEKLWMDAWVGHHCGTWVTISEYKHPADTVIKVLSEVFDVLPFCSVNDPTIDELEDYLHREDRRDDLELFLEYHE
jgi:hypothetical protein